MKTIVKISESERDELRSLYEKGQALQAWSHGLTKGKPKLMEQLLEGMTDSVAKSQEWWKKMTDKYNLKSESKSSYEINFDSCEIIMVDK